MPQGKWGSWDDLYYASEMAERIEPRGFLDFPIPANTRSQVFMPDGTIKTPDMIRIRNNGDGTWHGFPINSEDAEPIFNAGNLLEP